MSFEAEFLLGQVNAVIPSMSFQSCGRMQHDDRFACMSPVTPPPRAPPASSVAETPVKSPHVESWIRSHALRMKADYERWQHQRATAKTEGLPVRERFDRPTEICRPAAASTKSDQDLLRHLSGDFISVTRHMPELLPFTEKEWMEFEDRVWFIGCSRSQGLHLRRVNRTVGVWWP